MQLTARHRILVAITLAAAIAVPIAVHARAYDVGESTALVLVDTPRTSAVDMASGSAIGALAFRARVLASIAMQPLITDRVGAAIGVPPGRVVANPPAGPGTPAGDPGRGAYALRGAVTTLEGGDNPVLAITAQAPTPVAAQRMAQAAVAALGERLAATSARDATPALRRVHLRTLVGPVAGTVHHGTPMLPVLLAAGAALLLAAWLVSMLGRRQAPPRPRPGTVHA